MKRIFSLRLLLVLLVTSMALTTAVAFAQEAEAPAETAAEAPAAQEAPAAEAAEAAEEATNPLVPLGINTGFLIAQIVNFLLIFGLLTFFLWRPLMNILDNRAATIQKGIEDAAAAATARRNAEAETQKMRDEARAEIARTIEEARARGEELAKSLEADARKSAEAIRAEAQVRIEDERNRQLADLRGQVVSIAVAMSQRLIGETLDEQRQRALVSDFFAKVPADARSLSGAVEVVSAMPLSDEEKQRVHSEIGVSEVSFIVDPTILGGLILRAQDRVVDASVRSNLVELSGRLR